MVGRIPQVEQKLKPMQENNVGRKQIDSFPLTLEQDSGLTHIFIPIVNPSPMPAAALRTGDAKVRTGRALALLGVCDQESGMLEKMPAFKPVAAMEEQNAFGVESIEVTLNSWVKGGFLKQVSRDWDNDIPATERTWHVETLEKDCLEGVERVSSTWLGNPEVGNMVGCGNGESTRTGL